MAIPQLSPEERQAALEKAKAARIKRAEVRDDLKSGKLTLEKVLEMKNDPVVGRMKVSTLIETLPGSVSYTHLTRTAAAARRGP